MCFTTAIHLTLDQVLAYRIDNIIVVEPEDVATLQPAEGKDDVTLITCTPYGVNSHRLLVRGERVDYTPEEIEQRIAGTNPVTSKETWMIFAGIALLVLLVLVILLVSWMKSRRRKREHRPFSQTKAETWG